MKVIEIRKDGSKRVYTKLKPGSRTDPSWQKDCDVNEIVKKFQKTGQFNHLRKSQGVYADVSQITDLQSALMTVQLAHHAFDSLPAELRKKFDHDPQKMIDYLQDPKNNDEAVKLGLKSRSHLSDKNDGPISTESAVKAKPPKKDKNEPQSKNDSSADA